MQKEDITEDETVDFGISEGPFFPLQKDTEEFSYRLEKELVASEWKTTRIL